MKTSLVRSRIAVGCFLLSFASCGTLGTQLAPQSAYVKADRSTFEAIAPVVRNLADTDASNDPDLSGVNGIALLQLLDSWELRLEKAEEALAPAGTESAQ